MEEQGFGDGFVHMRTCVEKRTIEWKRGEEEREGKGGTSVGGCECCMVTNK